MGDIIADVSANKNLIKDFYEQLYPGKFNNLREIDQLFENQTTQIHPIWNNLNSPITIEEM